MTTIHRPTMTQLVEDLKARCNPELWQQIRCELMGLFSGSKDLVCSDPSKLIRLSLLVGDRAFSFNNYWVHLETLKVWRGEHQLAELALLVDDDRNSIVGCQPWIDLQSQVAQAA